MLKILHVILYCLFIMSCGKKPFEPAHTLQVGAVGIQAATLSDDGQYAVIGSLQHGISFWRLADGERLFDWDHTRQIDTIMRAADISPDGAWALTTDTHTLALWDTYSGAAERFWQTPGEVLSVQLGIHGDRALLGMTDNTAVLFDVRKGGIIHTLRHQNKVLSVALSDDGKVAVTGSEDYSSIAWNLMTGVAISKINFNDEVQLVALSADGQLAFSMSQYDRGVIWSTADGKITGELPLAAQGLKRGLRYTAARFSKDKRWLLTGRPDRLITLWQLPELIQRAHWQIPSKNPWKPSPMAIIDVGFSAHEQQWLATGSNGFIYQLQLPQ